jgi:hypothetical protein
MRETEPTHWPQCHFSRWSTWFTNVCSDAQFGPFDLSIAFWESGFFGICLAGFNMPMFYCSNNNITFRYILYMGRSLSNMVIYATS